MTKGSEKWQVSLSVNDLIDKLIEKDKNIERLNKVQDQFYSIQHDFIELKTQLKEQKENYHKDLSDAIINAESLIFKDSIPRKKIEDRIKKIDVLMKDNREVNHWEELSIVKKELKSLLESEKDDNQHQAEKDSHKSVDVGSYPSENPRGEQTLQHFGQSMVEATILKKKKEVK